MLLFESDTLGCAEQSGADAAVRPGEAASSSTHGVLVMKTVLCATGKLQLSCYQILGFTGDAQDQLQDC